MRTAAAWAWCFACLAVSSVAWEQTPEKALIYGVRPDGRPVTELVDSSTPAKVLVLYFVASDCPISNRTFPEMKRVRQEYEARGARFWYVYANQTEQRETVLAHQQAFDSGGEAVMDTSGTLAKMAHARVTPEISVLLPSSAVQSQWTPVYTGRVDNLYARIGLERPHATEHDAERAVGEALRRVPVEAADGGPVGCAIVGPTP